MSTQVNQVRSRVPRIAEAAVERARLTLVPRARRPGTRVPFVVLVSLLLLGGVGGLLCFNTSMQQASFTATALESQAQALNARRQGLQMQVDSLRNPQRVALEARHLGMVPAADPAFIRLGDGKVLGNAVPATGQDAVRLTPPPTRKPKDLRTRTVKVPVKLPAQVPAQVSAKVSAKKQAVDGAATAAPAGPTGTKKSHVR
jgi:type II secretory pathway pseudopilin PulG